MIVSVGETVCIIERRQFAEDTLRYFIGEVIASSENALRVKGHV